MDKTLKGGLLLKNSGKSEDLFTDYLRNVNKVRYIADGANGIIYKLSVPETYTSGYTYIAPNNYGKPVKEIAIKLCVLTSSDIKSFKDEVNIQTSIFKKSIKYLQPVCPGILYSSILRERKKTDFIKQLLEIDPSIISNKLPYLESEIDISRDLLTNSKYYIGLIVMEYENGYKRLFDYINSTTLSKEIKIKYLLYGLFIILKLAIETGYSQADFHIANIMIHPSLDYFGTRSGRPIILDFGYSRKIPQKTMNVIDSLIKSNDYISALKWICSVKRSDESSITKEEWSSHYGWVCRDWDLLKSRSKFKKTSLSSRRSKKSFIKVGEDLQLSIPKGITYANNRELQQLFNKRKIYEGELIKQFITFNKKSPINYPNLPLSNDIIIKRTYIGLFGGKTRRIKKISQKTKNKTIKNNIY